VFLRRRRVPSLEGGGRGDLCPLRRFQYQINHRFIAWLGGVRVQGYFRAYPGGSLSNFVRFFARLFNRKGGFAPRHPSSRGNCPVDYREKVNILLPHTPEFVRIFRTFSTKWVYLCPFAPRLMKPSQFSREGQYFTAPHPRSCENFPICSHQNLDISCSLTHFVLKGLQWIHNRGVFNTPHLGFFEKFLVDSHGLVIQCPPSPPPQRYLAFFACYFVAYSCAY